MRVTTLLKAATARSVIAAPLQQEAEASLHGRDVGLQFDGMFVGTQRLVGKGFRLEHNASVIPRRRIFWIELHGVVQHLLRFFGLTLGGECGAEMEIRRLKVWVQPQSFPKFAFGIGEPRLLGE